MFNFTFKLYELQAPEQQTDLAVSSQITRTDLQQNTGHLQTTGWKPLL